MKMELYKPIQLVLIQIVFKYRQEMEKVAGLFDVANEKDAEPVYTMVDGLPVLELKEAV